MCLLDSVQHWDALSIRCATASHRAADHPLRRHGRLGAACLLEYAAQAVAVHGALLRTADGRAGGVQRGMLVSARAVDLLVDSIDSIPQDLSVLAQRMHADERAALYDFEVCAGPQLIARGRLGIALTVAAGGT